MKFFLKLSLTTLLINYMLSFNTILAQRTLTFEQYLQWVIQYHPVAKSANLQNLRAKFTIQQARSNFDPQLNYSAKNKTFDGKNYYFLQFSELTVPTWWNIDLKSAWERNTGSRVSSEDYTPLEGLFSLGISVPITQSLIIDARKNAIRIAKQIANIHQAERLLLINQLLYEASLAYLEWSMLYAYAQQYQQILKIAQERKNYIVLEFLNGFASEMDTVDAHNTLLQRQIEYRENQIALFNASFMISNFIWSENETPLQLPDSTFPEPIQNLDIPIIEPNNQWLDNHPYILKYQAKAIQLQIEKRLKTSKLLPKLSLDYNFLAYPSRVPKIENYPPFESFKAGIKFSMPLFLRNERAELNFTKIKIQENQYELALKKLELQNKFNAYYQNYLLYQNQLLDVQRSVENYQKLYDWEYEKFRIGEANVLYLIIRETKLLESKLKLMATWQKFHKSTIASLWASAQLYEKLFEK